MTGPDWLSIGVVVALVVYTFRETRMPMILDPMRYHLRIKLGVDDFVILGQAEDASWLRMTGSVFEMCEAGDFVYVEQPTGDTLIVKVSCAVQMGGKIYVHAEKLKGTDRV